MSETWLDFAIRMPGPASKQGYAFAARRELWEIEGEVNHSTEGPLAAAFGELNNLDRRASWHFTIDTDGTVYQHYPLEAITWHCGVAGDRSQDTSLIGNATLVGKEHVDRIGGVQLAVLTPAAEAASARVGREIRRLCPRVAARPPTLRVNEWEHRWLSQTACPSGLIPWETYLLRLLEEQKEDWFDMATKEDLRQVIREELDLARPVVRPRGSPHVYEYADGKLTHMLSPAAFSGSGHEWGDVVEIDPANPEHEVWFRLPVVYPLGLPKEMGGK